MPAEEDQDNSERYVAPGVRLRHECEELGRLSTLIGEQIRLYPCVTYYGLKQSTRVTISLMLTFCDAYSNQISQCHLDEDEVDALLGYFKECDRAGVTSILEILWSEYRTRHGFTCIWDKRCRATTGCLQLLINSQKPAVINYDTHYEFLQLLAEFQDFCEQQS
ncbi:MAG TPA: hypothetical protein DD473_14185 [Planctomycetaceae bacterium]|nr:hypothetical protein [Planctomycetaceae bacterium]|tara:strand:+ start:100 stop:591 length:492 start_codon:yes stop_codon:yes gene_type:complete